MNRLCVWSVVALTAVAAVAAPVPTGLERSYWLHASLGLAPHRGYWGPAFAECEPLTREQVVNAAGLLCGTYGANRLYLIYHQDIPLASARQVFGWWREACPAEVELVPTLVLRMYDQARTAVFAPAVVDELAGFLRERVNPTRLAVYDVLPNRDQGPALAQLAAHYAGSLLRVGQQPGEAVSAPFGAVVQDTWSGFCHGRRNVEDWQQPGFGAETLRGWVRERNAGRTPVAWDLVVVAWDYGPTQRGEYPGYDDAAKNQPLPAGRNRLGVRLVAETASAELLAGFSSDLFILQENSRHAAHDGGAGAFYQTLRAGREYRGYYAVPFGEVAAIFRELRAGRWPDA